jgi:hypothetical protein
MAKINHHICHIFHAENNFSKLQFNFAHFIESILTLRGPTSYTKFGYHRHIFERDKGLRGRVVKTSVSYHETSHLQPASFRILLRPMWVWEKMRKVNDLFPNALYNVSGFSLPPITDSHHITEKLLSMAKNSKQSINRTGYIYPVGIRVRIHQVHTPLCVVGGD